MAQLLWSILLLTVITVIALMQTEAKQVVCYHINCCVTAY